MRLKQAPFHSAWSALWRITGIPLLVFMSGLTITMLMEHDPNVLAAAPAQAAQHLAQLQELKNAWIERLTKGRPN